MRLSDILLAGVFASGLMLSAWGSRAGYPAQLAGEVFVIGGGVVGISQLVRWRGRCDRLAAKLNEAGNAKAIIDPDAVAKIGPEPLGSAIGESLAAARRSALDAQLHARELALRLKICQAERDHAEAIIHSIGDGVVVTDPFDDVVLVNESAARTFKFNPDSARRTPVRQLVRDSKIVDLIRQVRQAGGRSGRRIVEHEIRNGDSTQTYKVTLCTVTDKPSPDEVKAPDAVAGVVAVLHDVTHEREVAQLKNDFVSNVSHELRTPLASIKAYIELLVDGEAQDDAVEREFYEIIQNDANRLGRLIDNILNLSRMESGLAQADRKAQSLTPILKDALDVVRPQANRKRITIREKLSPASYQTAVDRDMLYQAAINLLGNAVKYTPEGGEISVESAVDEQRGKLITRVSDNGVGIPQKDLPFIFDKFYRAESTKGMGHGTGLGLPLVKHVVETVHGGRLYVESQTGKGSCFGFELDLCAPEPSAAATAAAAA
jgi:two-component system phosphate regulon sensor histidine kinase PhoR